MSYSVKRKALSSKIKYSLNADFIWISGSSLFVDKTNLIKLFFEVVTKCWIVHAPSGYGKSTNLDMIKCFVEIPVDPVSGIILTFTQSVNYRTFKNNKLSICRDENLFKLHFANYAVIQLSLKNVFGDTLELLIEKYAVSLSKAFQNHSYLLQSEHLSKEDKDRLADYNNMEVCKKLSQYKIEHGLHVLIEMLSKHYANVKIIALIDDYDHPYVHLLTVDNHDDIFRSTQFLDSTFHYIINLDLIFRCLLVGSVSTNFIEAIIELTKCLISTFPVCYSYNEYFGFNEEDIIKLLQKNGCLDISSTIKSIFHYYGTLTLARKSIVSISSVIEYLQTRIFRIYEKPPVGDKINKCLNYLPFRHMINKLLISGSINITGIRIFNIYRDPPKNKPFMFCNSELPFYYLMNLGFFDVKTTNLDFKLSPTMLGRFELKKYIENFYGKSLLDTITSCAEFFNNLFLCPNFLLEHSLVRLLNQLRNVIYLYMASDPLRKEKTIHCIADILSRTGFYYNGDIIDPKFPDRINGTFFQINNNGLLSICVEFDSDIHLVFAKATQQRYTINRIDKKITIGITISIGGKLKLIMQWCINDNLDEIKYCELMH